MKIKVSELSGVALDWAVAKVVGVAVIIRSQVHPVDSPLRGAPYLAVGDMGLFFNPSTDWRQGGPLIEKYGVDLSAPPCIDRSREIGWQARPDDGQTSWHSGNTALVAAMRAIVSSQVGEEIEIPRELAP